MSGAMTERSFDRWMADYQVAWRRRHVADQRHGTQNGLSRPWILPVNLWEQGLWPGIRDSLPAYLDAHDVQKHLGVHNLKSSWMLCANLYFPFGRPEGREILASFLRQYVSPRIEAVEAVELEYEEKPPLDPQTLLGEPQGGQRGAKQTSPDVAFVVRTATGKGLMLTENKLVEHSFYSCSGRSADVQNPDKNRCLDWAKVQSDLSGQCWQLQWSKGLRKNRRYWKYIRLSERGRRALRWCPAATAGYQLFRQQALAEAIAESGRYDLVVSSAAYDARNEDLIHCMHSTGVDDFTAGWGPLFEGTAQFATFTHQQWVAWVRARDAGGRWRDWLSYVQSRYGLGEAVE